MLLVLSAQDIHRLEVVVMDGERVRHEAVVETPPEGFLSTVNALVNSWNMAWKDFTRVAVVSGPGSFTSTRVIVTIANGMAFGRNIPIVSVENPDRKPLVELVPDMLSATPNGFVAPVYDRPPHITSRKASDV